MAKNLWPVPKVRCGVAFPYQWQKENTPPKPPLPNEVLGYDTQLSDGKAATLDLWSSSSLPLLPGSLRVVGLVRGGGFLTSLPNPSCLYSNQWTNCLLDNLFFANFASAVTNFDLTNMPTLDTSEDGEAHVPAYFSNMPDKDTFKEV